MQALSPSFLMLHAKKRLKSWERGPGDEASATTSLRFNLMVKCLHFKPDCESMYVHTGMYKYTYVNFRRNLYI